VLEIDIAAEKYLIINLYDSPNKNDAEFLMFLDDYLDEIADFTGTIVFMGDFNLIYFIQHIMLMHIEISYISMDYTKLYSKQPALPMIVQHL
jgi:hypothetical protein